MTNNKLSVIVTEKEDALLKQLREIKYGQVVIHMEESQPVRIERIEESIKL